MLYLLLLFRALLAAGVQTLTIDSQLGTSIEDCFERISIGERVPKDAIYRNVTELTTKECEQLCKLDKQCQSYDYGVGAKGNATCELGKVDEKEIKEKNLLQRDPDYDVYVRRFQCEQSPPKPIQTVMDDPEADSPEQTDRDGPDAPHGHRPVFRPQDENAPLSDDYLVSSNLPYRPDDYQNKPNIDEPPSYGNHKPQDLSYKPPRLGYKPDPYDEMSFQGYNKPNNHKTDPYGVEKLDYNYIIRPNRRPYQIKPDPYGSNQGSGPVGPPDRPYKASRPYDRPNKYPGDNDVHVEIIDPPYGSQARPHSDSNYGQDFNRNQYGSQNYGDRRPDPVYGPPRPNIPGYGHLGAGYAAEHGYGLYKPSKATEPYKPDQSSYSNQGSYNSNQASYGSSQSEFASNQGSYGSSQSIYGSNRPLDNDNGYSKPQKPNYPYKRPVYSSQPSYNSNQASDSNNQESYGSSNNQYSSNTNYGSNQSNGGNSRPGYQNTGNYNKPLYGNDHGLYGNHNNLYGDYGSNNGLYASSHGAYNQASGTNQGLYSNNGYGSGTYGTSQSNYAGSQSNYAASQSSYDSHASYNNKPYNKPAGNDRPYSYEKPVNVPYNDRPAYENNPSYGSERPSYANDRPSYNDRLGYSSQRPAYIPDRPSYGSSPTYANNKPGYSNESPSYGDDKLLYGTERPSYGSQKPAYGDDKPLYGTERPSYGSQKPGYGDDTASYSTERPSYGSQKPGYGDDKPSYGTERPSYGSQKPAYGDDKPSYGTERPSYGSQKPGYGDDTASYSTERPSYGSQKPGYGDDKPSYGTERPSYGSQKPAYGDDKPSYGTERPSYGSQKPAYGDEKPSYGTERPSYGSQKPAYDDGKPSYGTERPLYGSQKPAYGDDKPSYGTERPMYGSQRPSYGSEPLYGNDKPSYGSEKPSYGSDPSYGSEKPYGSDKPSYGPQKPSYGSEAPSYGSDSSYSNTKPSYGNDKFYENDRLSYGNQRPSYGSIKPAYGNEPAYDNDRQYGTYRPGHDTAQHIYGHKTPSYGDKNYGNDRYASYSNQGAHGHSHASYGSNQASYASNQASYGSSQASYGSNQGAYGSNDEGYSNQGTGSYASNQASYDRIPSNYQSSQASYGNQESDYDKKKTNYGNNQETYSSPASYGSNEVNYGSNQPTYANTQATYGSTQAGYGSNQASYGTNQANYGSNQATYGNNQASYGSNQAAFGNNQASYGSNQASYGNNEANYGSDQQSYATNKPAYGNNPLYTTNQPGFGSPEPSHENPNETGYSSIKPVYEYENRPGRPLYKMASNGDLVTSRPVAVGDFGDKSGKNNYEACFRRVLAGRRALRSFVQKAVPCESLEDCRRECATERRFPCESFNYRIDNSFRGRGLCELMTKPIEAFDLRRDFVDDKDFDFYELDRNSLEPNCPDTLRGPGILHSGFLSSKTDRQGSEQWDRSDGDRDNKRHLDNRYNDRRHDDHFVPYQIGMSRSTEDNAHWGQYGGSYGGYDRYYKDRDDYHNSINYWSTSDKDHNYGVRPLSSTNFDYHSLAKNEDILKDHRYGHGSWKRGRWNSSGASWSSSDFEESTFHQDHHIEKLGRSDDAPRSEDASVKDCSSRRRPGMSLGSGAIRRSIFARNVVDCEAACFGEREFKCVSYSYRYSSSHGSDNCYLSERPYRGLELSTDSGSDVYAMPQDQDCITINHKPWVESECFWHVRSGAAVDINVVKAALTVAGLGACEAECIRAQGFFCRGFSFRFDSPTIGDDLENCILTSSPPTSLETGHGLRPNKGHELYARGNYGRGCEPALYDDSQHVETQCYLQYDNSARLTPSATRGRAQAKDEMSCGQACTDAPFRCLSFSYNNNAPPDTENCLLSEIRLFDLQENVDYVHSTDDWLFAFDLFNGQCWRKVHGDGDYETPTPELPRPIPISRPGSNGPFSSSGQHRPSSGPPGFHGPPSGPPEFHGPPSGPPEFHGPPGFHGPPSEPPEFHGPPFGSSGPPGLHKSPSGSSGPSGPIGPSGPFGIGFIHESSDHFIPSGPNGPYRPTGPDHKPGYPVTNTGLRPEYPPHLEYKPVYPPDDFKPSFAEPDRPGFHDRPPTTYISHKPVHHPDSDFKPGFHEIDYKPGISQEPGYSDGYRPGSNYKPSYQPIEPGLKPNYPSNSFKPDFGSNYKPDYPLRPQPPDNFRPGYLGDSKPAYPPRPDDLDRLKPGYRPIDKPLYPSKPYHPGYSPEFKPDHHRPEDQFYFKPDMQGDKRPLYPTRLPEPVKPYHPVSKPGLNEDYQQRPFRPVEPKPAYGRPGSYADRKPVKPAYQGDREDNEGISVSWRHYTVSGYPCRSGTSCAQNVISGHWACEPEGGEIGSWDYCCAANHRCGYSEGFHKPWCYVGPSEDQWRPCSEKYYPYHQHKDPHPSQGHRDSRPVPSEDRPHSYNPGKSPPYLSDGDRKYWDDLYKNGPQAYYDKHGNPLPGYSRVPTEDRPQVKYQHNYPPSGSGNWVQVPPLQTEGQPIPGGLGAPRYWPVAYLHKGPPPNMTYFRYNETTTTETSFRSSSFNRELPDPTPRPIDISTDRDIQNIYDHTDRPDRNSSIDNKHEDKDHQINTDEPPKTYNFTTERNHRDNKKRNITDFDLNNIKNDVKTTTEKFFLETTEKLIETSSISDVESSREDVIIDKNMDTIKGIDDKLNDFSSLEVVDLDTKSLKTIEEEKQIEEIGRLLASRRGGKIILEKRAQKDIDTKNIALDKDLMEFNFGNRFSTTERRGIVQKVTKEEINRDRKEFDRYTDKSLEVSETTFVRPPRVLTTTENIRKAVVNGKVFYEASLREQRDLFNATRRSRNLNPVDKKERPLNGTLGRKVFTKNVNPVRRVRRVFKKRYNPDEVRRRLLEREKNSKAIETSKRI